MRGGPNWVCPPDGRLTAGVAWVAFRGGVKADKLSGPAVSYEEPRRVRILFDEVQ
jgi:hypothetical protein